MQFRINPALRRFEDEAKLIGHILASFGEIELTVCRNAGMALQMYPTIMKALYQLRSATPRIEVASELMRPKFLQHDLAEDFEIGLGMVGYCTRVRNLYAHCNWGDYNGDKQHGLFFADLENSAETDDFEHEWKHIDMPLLEAQEVYFGWAMEQLEYLHNELALRDGRLQFHVWPKPIIPAQPPLHNPEEAHVPPWLNEDQKALHVARALASRGGPPTPTRGQKTLDKARAAKRARQEAQRRKSQEGEARATGSSDPSED
jgi:hypothetical protein